MMLLVGLALGSAQAQITYRVGYDVPNQTYRVYMTSATSYSGNASRLATAQVTLLFPHGTGNNQFKVTNLHGKVVSKAGQSIEMMWDYSSRANAPVEDPSVDFQSFGYTNSSGLLFDIPANQEIELFSFQNSGPCLGPVRLITNTEPFASHIPNSVGGTAGNAMYIFATQNTNIYSGNYGSPASCAATPDLTVAISGPSTLTAGTATSYSVNVSNLGGAATTGPISVTTLLPPGLTYSSATGAGWSCASSPSGSNTQVVCSNSGPISVSATSTYSLLLTGASSVATATFSALVLGDGDQNLANNTASKSVTVVQAASGSPNLNATITGPASASAGSVVSYTVNITNTGSGATTAATTSTITLAAGLTYTSFTGTGWTVSSAAGASGTTILTATYSSTLSIGASATALILNVTPTTATIGTSLIINGVANTVGNVVAGGSSFSLTILVLTSPVSSPVLSTTLTGPSTTTVNVPASYTISVTNSGTVATTGPITTTLTLPAGMTYVSYSGAGWTVSSVVQSNGTTLLTAIYTALVAPGASASPLIITVIPVVSVAQSVTIFGGSTTTGASAGSNFSLVVSVQVVVTNTTFDLSASLNGPASLTSGVPVNLTLILTNVASNSAVVSPTTQTTLPVGMTLNSVTGIGWTTSSNVVNGVTIVTAVYSGTVAAQTALPVLIFNVTAVNNLSTVVTLAVSGLISATGDTNPANNFYNTPFVILSGSTTSTTNLSTTVSIDIRAPNLYQATTVTIVVTNNGPSTAVGVVSQVTLPNGQPIISLTATTGTSFNPATGQWTIGTLQTGSSVTLIVTMSAATGGIATVINSVTAINVSSASAQSCFSVPMDLCSGQSLLTSIPASYTGVQWFKDGMLYATGNTLTINQPGTYTVQAPGICSSGNCCPLIVRASTNCCVQGVCVPFLITRTKSH